MLYSEALSNYFAYGSVPDGYFGERCQVKFSFDADSGKTLIVGDCGYWTAPIPQAIDTREALWLLQHHPSASAIQVRGYNARKVAG